ncbi:DUF1294 domain-containing protein [Phycicoccus sp. BSK3Z-2]|uniref:DUF1294 domain-containing protein n=1 Tax=Phycicoccus avicenniae TaxID=2828860 RepID=A0A941D6K4_9MICO|nr:DUF1294 domain-containing protein [Phycicoccus avicenniae]
MSFLTATDERGRPQAADARLLGRSRRNRAGLTAALVVAGVFLVVLVVLVATGSVTPWVAPVYLVLGLVSFALYRVDKRAARDRTRRIPESGLHLVDLLGGWPGGLVARPLFRHKTTKQPFRTVFWLTAVVNVVVLVLLVTLTG